MSDHIIIHNLEFQGRHGATADERKLLRRFQVDVTITAPLEHAAASDRLADTFDYHELCSLVVAVGTERTFHLVEALAGAIVAAIAERCSTASITVEVRKLHPPCPGNPAYAAVRMSRDATGGGTRG